MALKSAWAQRERKRVMKECLALDKKEKIDFVESRGGLLYAEYGMVKNYGNNKQVDSAVERLRALGHNVERTYKWPFLIIKKEKGPCLK